MWISKPVSRGTDRTWQDVDTRLEASKPAPPQLLLPSDACLLLPLPPLQMSPLPPLLLPHSLHLPSCTPSVAPVTRFVVGTR